MPHDLPPGRADGLLDADFPGPLRDGDQHDVHDTDSAHQQGDARDAAQYHAHGGHLLRALAHGGVAVLQLILPHARVDGLPQETLQLRHHCVHVVGLIYLDRKAGELGGAQYGPIQGVGNHRHVVHGALLAPVLLVVDPHHGEGLTAEVDGLPDGIRILKQAVRHVGAEHAHPAAPVDVKGADVPPLLQGVVPADGELVAAQVECPTVQRGGAVFHGQACGQIGAHPQHHIAQLSIPIVIEGVYHIHRPAGVVPVHRDVDLVDAQLLIVGGDVRVVAGHQRHQH